MSGLDLPNGRGGDTSGGSGELIEDIPEDLALTLRESPYRPQQSPLREDLPPFPGGTESRTSPGDLDSQIEKLQAELERCRRENNATSGGEAAPAYGTLTGNPGPGHDQVDAGRNNPRTKKQQQQQQQHPPKEQRTCCGLLWRILRFFLVTFIMLGGMLCVLLVVAMETDAPIPLIQDMRTWPQVEHFRQEHYAPVRDNTVNTVKSWFA